MKGKEVLIMKMNEVIENQKEPLKSMMKKMFRSFPRDAEVRVRDLPEKKTFLHEGDPVDTVYVLLKGRSTASWMIPGYGMYQALHEDVLQLFGDMAILGGFDNYSTSVSTVSRCRILSMTKEDFLTWMHSDRPVYEEIVRRNLRMLFQTTEVNRRSSLQKNTYRLLEYLEWYYAKNITPGQKGVLVRKTREEMLNDIGGLSLRSLNRYIAELVEKETVSIYKGKIRITEKQYKQIQRELKEN